jgi:hypothetical protein
MAIATILLRPIFGFFVVVPIAALVYLVLLFATRSVRPEQLKEIRAIIFKKKYEASSSLDS